MKYDELIVDPLSGVIFQDPDSQFCMPKVYEELAFVLENRQVPREDMDALIINALNMVNLNVTPVNVYQRFKWRDETEIGNC